MALGAYFLELNGFDYLVTRFVQEMENIVVWVADNVIDKNLLQQMLYPDLTMTIALGGKRGRMDTYFDAFEQGRAQWYHTPQATFSAKFKQHVVDEIRYLALGVTSEYHSQTKQIDRLWPVKRVALLPRYAITAEQAGRESSSDEPYYLFELGRPLTLQQLVKKMPHRPIKNTMKLTTLNKLEGV